MQITKKTQGPTFYFIHFMCFSQSIVILQPTCEGPVPQKVASYVKSTEHLLGLAITQHSHPHHNLAPQNAPRIQQKKVPGHQKLCRPILTEKKATENEHSQNIKLSIFVSKFTEHSQDNPWICEQHSSPTPTRSVMSLLSTETIITRRQPSIFCHLQNCNYLLFKCLYSFMQFFVFTLQILMNCYNL